MSDDTATELAACVRYARTVTAALPIDEAAERLVARLMRESRPTGTTSRKLTRRAP